MILCQLYWMDASPYNFKVLQLFKTSKNIRITSRLASICYKNNLHIHNYINSISQRTIMYLISTILWSNHVLFVEVSSNKFKPSHPCHLHIWFLQLSTCVDHYKSWVIHIFSVAHKLLKRTVLLHRLSSERVAARV